MTRRWQTCVVCAASVALLAGVTSAIVSRASKESSPPPGTSLAQRAAPNNTRNLRLQPEAAALNRLLGNRFKPESPRSVLAGNLTLGSVRQPVTIIRSQTANGETVELLLADNRFLWNDAEGIKGATASPGESERLLVERLVFDSPDQFVLAQLRGASYQTIFRNLRPTDAGDDYAGPLWTMVRINDPQTVESAAPKSAWRLYYINSNSGLIDRIECDVDGQRIAASFLQWTEQNGEKVPSHIRWTSNSETLMEFQLTSFSQGQ